MSDDNVGAIVEKANVSSKRNVNEEISSIQPLRFRPFLLHLNIAPFFLGYAVWFFVWFTQFGVEEYPELGLIVTALIAILQIVVCLFCYWFVECRVFMQCTKVDDPESAEVVQVTPTPNNGFAELVYLHRKFSVKEDDFSKPTEKTTW